MAGHHGEQVATRAADCGDSMIDTPFSLARERRSQPQQIADLQQQMLALQGQYSTLVGQFSKDSASLHQAWATLGKAHLEAAEALIQIQAREMALRSSLVARLRWLCLGR